MSEGKTAKGSQRDIRLLFNVATNRQFLESKLTEYFRKEVKIKQWLSPLVDDQYKEYSDEGFMDKIGLKDCANQLVGQFWPKRGPVWDGLAKMDDDTILLFEAKAHISELFGIGMKARAKESRELALNALKTTADYIGANYDERAWTDSMYQTANRLAHLYFLNQKIRVKAKLVYLIFLDDDTVPSNGETKEVWEMAIKVAERFILKLPFKKKVEDGRDSWKEWVVHLFLSVNDLKY